jgi:hypothetical protein
MSLRLMIYILSLSLAILISACSSTPNRPEDIKVKISREQPTDKDCRDLGVVTGKSISTKATSDEVLDDLKKDAALKGGNYVWLENFSTYGTAAKGTAYFCP